ncbi:carbohydrate-binding module family 20 domain-containing protein [Microbulbifer sp. JSM ZJ756]|uniref:carbohydrate-binding module family 20 domain-containing protein n=1 Tax=Microbulbifer sp. JSM ZJ756 TaxID=3376191 RepID=UPI0037AF25F6
MRYFSAMMFLSLALTTASTTAHAVPRTAFVHLFEWQWDQVAAECENFLGPKGFSAVQVSPPQKSINGSQWWTRYQPVSYAIEGRSGSRQQFADMVSRCNAAGVDIYVDAVINHMAAWDRNFPEVPYGPNDFHNCTDDIDYSNKWSIQNCDLVGLNDLKTESAYVQGKIADYLNDLISMGVAGFRIDAAKHMPAADINAIVQRLNGDPYIYQEVIGAAGEPVQAGDYTWVGDVTEFNFTNTMGYYFKLRGPLKEISNIGNWQGWLPTDDAITFVANHDNQRQNTDNTITHKDGNNANNMAHVFLLGWPYGYPKVMSSYDWSDHDQGPPASAAGDCSNGWLCEHRNRAIANMVAFRNNTADYFGVTNYWDNGNHQLAWGRGGLGFVAINMEGSDLNRSFQTGMPAGTYCDIIQGEFDYDAGTCSGPTISVDGNGNANFNVYYRNASAIHVGARVGVPCPDCGGNSGGESGGGGSTGGGAGGPVNVSFSCANGYTYWGQSVYVVGNQDELGNWDPAGARVLDASAYPTWSATIELPASTDVEWKCLKREENNSGAGIEWQPGSNNGFNTGTSDSSQSAGF